MALKFEFRKEKIVLDASFFMFKEFVAVWNYDKSKTKDKANRLLYFIFLICDLNHDNPVVTVDSDKREIEAKFYAFKDKSKKFTDKEYILLKNAVERYIKINTAPEERLLNALDRKAEEISAKLEQVKPETSVNTDNGVVKYVSNSTIITKGLSKLAAIRKNREALISAIKNETMTSKVRGKVTLSPLVRGLITIDF